MKRESQVVQLPRPAINGHYVEYTYINRLLSLIECYLDNARLRPFGALSSSTIRKDSREPRESIGRASGEHRESISRILSEPREPFEENEKRGSD